EITLPACISPLPLKDFLRNVSYSCSIELADTDASIPEIFEAVGRTEESRTSSGRLRGCAGTGPNRHAKSGGRAHRVALTSRRRLAQCGARTRPPRPHA